jgi:hypothetical protein
MVFATYLVVPMNSLFIELLNEAHLVEMNREHFWCSGGATEEDWFGYC